VIGALASLIIGAGSGNTRQGTATLPDGTTTTFSTVGDLIRALANSRARAATPATPDQPQLPPLPPSQSAPPLPNVPPAVGPEAFAPPSPYQPSPADWFRAVGGTTNSAFDEAYGRGPSMLERARKIARNIDTMQAQVTDQDVWAAARRRNERSAAGRRRRNARVARGGRGIIGAILTGAFGATDLGNGELTPEQMAKVEKDVRDAAAAKERARQAAIDALEVTVPKNPYGFPNARVPGGNRTVDRRAAATIPLPFPDIRGVTTAPQPRTAPTRTQRMARIVQRAQSMTRNPYAQLGVLGLSILGRRSRSAGSDPATVAVAPLPIPDSPTQGPGSSPFPLTGLGTGLLPSTSTSAPGCSCKPKKRGPRRQCLERAPIKWAGGRRKGKAAGSKCIRWRN